MPGAIRGVSPEAPVVHRLQAKQPWLFLIYAPAGRGIPLGRHGALSGHRRTEPYPARRSDRPRQLDLESFRRHRRLARADEVIE